MLFERPNNSIKANNKMSVHSCNVRQKNESSLPHRKYNSNSGSCINTSIKLFHIVVYMLLVVSSASALATKYHKNTTRISLDEQRHSSKYQLQWIFNDTKNAISNSNATTTFDSIIGSSIPPNDTGSMKAIDNRMALCDCSSRKWINKHFGYCKRICVKRNIHTMPSSFKAHQNAVLITKQTQTTHATITSNRQTHSDLSHNGFTIESNHKNGFLYEPGANEEKARYSIGQQHKVNAYNYKDSAHTSSMHLKPPQNPQEQHSDSIYITETAQQLHDPTITIAKNHLNRIMKETSDVFQLSRGDNNNVDSAANANGTMASNKINKRIHTADYADLSLLKHDDRINNTVWSSSQFNTMPQYSRHRIDSVQLKHREKRSASIVSSSPLPLSSPAPAIPAPTTETAYSVNVTCLETNNYDNTVPCYQQNETCVGAPEYCNYTREEYIKMLYDYIFPTTGEWILIGCHGIVFIVGLIGNILVCIAVYANATMRTVTNIFIVNLAIADLLVIILCLPATVVWDVTETWFLGEAMCKGVLYLQTVSVTVSVLTLTFISIDRWYAICFPLRYVSTNGRAWCSVAIIWIAALLSDVPELIASTTRKKELRFDLELFTQCVVTWDKDTEKNFFIARFGALYVLPLFLMSVAYFKIICVLWKSDTIPGHKESYNKNHLLHQSRTSSVANTSTMSQLRTRRKAAKMLVVVVVLFAICFLPVHCLNILRYSIDIEQSEIVTILSLMTHWLCYANSAMNPLIYNFMSGEFRRKFVGVLDRCRCNQREIHSHHSLYLNAAATRLQTISPNTRSLYQSSNPYNKSFREKQTMQTTFLENICETCTGSIGDSNQAIALTTNGGTFNGNSIPNGGNASSKI